ncbi:hypothetical protein DFO67_1327 [Modicisalibacter xianhensis]|uniref:Uncharacterized protein n=1 Tax=Modicisalibacter xianhensis TaxID=442341 RepID=A0A4R8FDT1_9GAMM|nr:hypothetical protein [Halomonas xianhensis]TDX21888.1 hypothetical protein DFO67_1327 [Halomonas xianhensis]
MARGTTLEQLTVMLKAEIGASPDYAANADMNFVYHQYLRRHYENLYDGWAWPFKRIERDIATAAGQRYYDWPAEIDGEQELEFWVDENGTWIRLEQGIGPGQYNSYEEGDRQDYPYRWDWQGEDQFEIWPTAALDGVTLRIVGTKNPNKLISESDVCDIDDQMVVLYAASELLLRDDPNRAQQKSNMAQQREDVVKKKLQTRKRLTMSGRSTERPAYGNTKVIAIRGQS